jgi:LuxR family transcriptional regulator, maltose regulon positive regulatory protein
MQAGGQAPAAEQILFEAYESCGDKTRVYALMILRTLCFMYHNTGKPLAQTRQMTEVLLELSQKRRVVIQKNWACWILGMVCYQMNDLEAAKQYFNQIVENPYIAQLTTVRDATAALVMIHQMKGEGAEAWQMVESMSRFDLEQAGSEDTRTRSLRARLMLMQGDREGASQWAETFTSPPPDQPLIWFNEPQVTRVRVLVTRGTHASLLTALQILDNLDEITRRTNNTRYRIEVLALQALALQALGETSRADAVIRQAVELTSLGGFIRIFVDLGKPMQEMLGRLNNQVHSSEMIQRILAAFQQETKNSDRRLHLAEPSVHLSLGNISLTEPLTPRELDILNLMRGTLSNKEIAQKLYISYATVKRHTINIYGKLGVNTRKQAVDRAKELNIFPSD